MNSKHFAAMRVTGAALLLALASGCGSETGGPQRYIASGSVTLDGKPLTTGYILFEPEDRSIASDAGPIKDGKYSFESQPGKKKVQISATRPTGRTQEELNPGSGNEPVYEQYLPAKYSSDATELRAEVSESGENTFDFDLKMK